MFEKIYEEKLSAKKNSYGGKCPNKYAKMIGEKFFLIQYNNLIIQILNLPFFELIYIFFLFA